MTDRQVPLPAKEAAIFKSMVRFYEHKQYKKALKSAEQVLKRIPDHGETLAMKGLVCHFLGRPKEETFELARKGIRSDINSPVCWHVFGLLHRANKNYEEAIKCYLNALRHGKENLQILRDLSLLQIQMRNLEGYQETRHQLLTIRPQNKASWIGLAIAYHLIGNFEMAVKVLDAYEGTLTKEPKRHLETSISAMDADGSLEFELGEIILYKVSMLCEAECYQEAVDQLLGAEKDIHDKQAYREFLALGYLKLHRLFDAAQIYRQLIIENPECLQLYEGYIRSHGLNLITLDEPNKSKILELLDDLAKDVPPTCLIERLSLKLAPIGNDFEGRMTVFLDRFLRRGLPSLFASLKHVLESKDKETIVERLVLNMKEQQQQHSEDSSRIALWADYFLAQLYDKNGQTLKSLSHIDAAIAQDNTILDFFMMKARILKHAGDTQAAVEFMNKARELDLADRCINTKCVKYMIYNGQLEEADRIVALFLRVRIRQTVFQSSFMHKSEKWTNPNPMWLLSYRTVLMAWTII